MKIVSIGGGQNGRPGTTYEVKIFDEEIVRLTNKQNPNLLFIAFTQKDIEGAEYYFNIINKNFSNLGCICDHLREKDLIDISIVKSKIEKADIIYVGGGNTLRLMNMLRKYKIDDMLKIAGEKGAVLCGISAGGICWCDFGNSDSRKFTSNSKKLIKVTGLGFIHALFCPHYNVEKTRQKDLKRMMKKTKGVALAFSNCTALKIVDDNYEVLKSRGSAKALKCFWQRGEYVKIELNSRGSVSDLISK